MKDVTARPWPCTQAGEASKELTKTTPFTRFFDKTTWDPDKYLWRSFSAKITNCLKHLAILELFGIVLKNRSSHQRCTIKKAVLKSLAVFTGSNCVGVSFLIKLQASNAPTQVFYCEYYESFKNIYSEDYLQTSASKKALIKVTGLQDSNTGVFLWILRKF